MLLIKFILFFFIFSLIMGAVVIVSIVRKFRNATRQFQNQMNGNNGAWSARDPFSTGKNRNSSPTEEGVIDNRTPEQSSKKIIPKDEGEYVDFEE